MKWLPASPVVSVILATNAHVRALSRVLHRPWIRVANRAQFSAAATAAKGRAIGFVDIDMLAKVDEPRIPVIGIVDDLPPEARAKTVRSLGMFAWLEHIITATILGTPLAAAHLEALFDRFAHGPTRDMICAPGIGRVALLARASRREERFERMRQFFTAHGISQRAMITIGEIAEELVTNALYNAPTEAGFFPQPVSRTVDVELPPERACEISYGIEQDNPFVRVRDTFGAFSRGRLLEVLTRCNSGGVELDTSRGGAGLGMWRVFSTASTIAVTVVPGKLTDILVGVPVSGRRSAQQLHALHLFFGSETSWDSLFPAVSLEMLEQSVTLMLA
jgi:hypothetical protein